MATTERTRRWYQAGWFAFGMAPGDAEPIDCRGMSDREDDGCRNSMVGVCLDCGDVWVMCQCSDHATVDASTLNVLCECGRCRETGEA